jgi:hypothetical protein
LYKQLEGEGRWQALLQVHNNRGNAIEMRRSILAQSLRIYVGGTSDDKRQASRYSPLHGRIMPRKALGKPFAQEIEVYGLISKDKK